jgi:hypothetical protein
MRSTTWITAATFSHGALSGTCPCAVISHDCVIVSYCPVAELVLLRLSRVGFMCCWNAVPAIILTNDLSLPQS